MSKELRTRLARLQEIAQLKADKSIARYAAVQAEASELRNRLKTIDTDMHETLRVSVDFEASRLALKYAALKRQEKASLMAQLARVESERKSCLKAAQRDEGRRIALRKLRDQAS